MRKGDSAVPGGSKEDGEMRSESGNILKAVPPLMCCVDGGVWRRDDSRIMLEFGADAAAAHVSVCGGRKGRSCPCGLAAWRRDPTLATLSGSPKVSGGNIRSVRGWWSSRLGEDPALAHGSQGAAGDQSPGAQAHSAAPIKAGFSQPCLPSEMEKGRSRPTPGPVNARGPPQQHT